MTMAGALALGSVSAAPSLAVQSPWASVSASGFIVAVALFSAAQATLSLLIVKLPRAYASLLPEIGIVVSAVPC